MLSSFYNRDMYTLEQLPVQGKEGDVPSSGGTQRQPLLSMQPDSRGGWSYRFPAVTSTSERCQTGWSPEVSTLNPYS